MIIKLLIVNAFSETVYGGNPAGVVLNSPKLTDNQMKLICKEINVSETAFVYPSDVADYNVRFFSPEIEVDLCGHATIATIYAMLIKNFFNYNKLSKITQNTNVGILPIEISYNSEGTYDNIMMIQKKPQFIKLDLDFYEISKALNIAENSIDKSLPKQKASTGLFTLPICIKSFKTIEEIDPDSNRIVDICRKYDVGSIHTFTFDAIESKSLYHARNFAPLYGINEDPVTGTANGAVCSYLYYNKIISSNNVICEQGDIINRAGRVFVEIVDNKVKVGGKAKLVEERDICL